MRADVGRYDSVAVDVEGYPQVSLDYYCVDGPVEDGGKPVDFVSPQPCIKRVQLKDLPGAARRNPLLPQELFEIAPELRFERRSDKPLNRRVVEMLILNFYSPVASASSKPVQTSSGTSGWTSLRSWRSSALRAIERLRNVARITCSRSASGRAFKFVFDHRRRHCVSMAD